MLCTFCALRVGRGEWRGAPTHPGVPLSKPQACAERDPLVAKWPPPSILILSSHCKRSGVGLGFRGAACPRFGATCALTARTPNPESPAAASAAPRSGFPALGRGFLLADCLDIGSHPVSAQSPKARVVHRGFSYISNRGRPSGVPRWPSVCWVPGWAFRDGGVGAPGRNWVLVAAP